MYKQFLKPFTIGFLLLANIIPLVYADFYVIPIEKLPKISIADVTMLEGNYKTGLSVDFKFPIMLGHVSKKDVSVVYITNSGTAKGTKDYTKTKSTLIIPAGDLFAEVSIPVKPDHVNEADETFTVTLSSPSGATLGRSVATATIVNDDMPFTKVDSNGSIIPFAQQSDDYATTPWDCVIDEKTELMWEVKLPVGHFNYLRLASHTYTWYDSNGATNGGNAGTENGGTCFDLINCDTEKYVAAVNQDGLCGYNDWRMPLRTELESLLGTSSTLNINIQYFPQTLSYDYWSASPSANYLDSAWYISFKYGNSGDNLKRNSRHVRLVRAGQ